MRQFNGSPDHDQLKEVIQALKITPYSRRHIISLWNPLQTDQMRLPPCYLYFQFYVAGCTLNMYVTQRSGDLFAGIPYDAGVFTLFLIYVAHEVGLRPGSISLNIVDAHIYADHVPAVVEYLRRPHHIPPTWFYNGSDVTIYNYKHEPKIKINIAI